MKTSTAKQIVENILGEAGIRINGDRPWDIRVQNPLFYNRVLAKGSLALGESYMDGWWECDALDQFFDRLLRARLDKKAKKSLPVIWTAIRCKLTNRQRPARAFVIGKRHYDIGNTLFRAMLDKEMNYSCGYWKSARTLDEAQKAKLDLVCGKIRLQPGMKVLDIGCGWGGFAKYAAETYGAEVLGITVSKEQVRFARKRCRNLSVRVELMDYRLIHEEFDRIVSLGMFEHVGVKNHRTFMKVAHRSLAPQGLFLLHTIAGNRSVRHTDPWIGRYIFPNSMLPSAKQIAASIEGLFVIEDWHSFGHYYDATLMAWYRNFVQNRDRIQEARDRRFYRMWTYYLLACAGSFRARRNQVWQIVFSKQGIQGGYSRIN